MDSHYEESNEPASALVDLSSPSEAEIQSLREQAIDDYLTALNAYWLAELASKNDPSSVTSGALEHARIEYSAADARLNFVCMIGQKADQD